MNIRRILKFSLVGVINTSVDFVVFIILVHVMLWEVLLANTVSYSLGTFNSFFMNKHWTFQDRTRYSSSLGSFFNFVLINASSLIISSAVVFFLSKSIPAVLAKIFSVCGVLAWNYILTRRFVFKTSNL